MALLHVRELTVWYESDAPSAPPAVDKLTFSVESGEMVGMAGPSGCGKTTVALATLGLLPATSRISGSIQFNGRELTTAGERELQSLRGSEVALAFQEPGLALHPLMRAGDQIAEVARAHGCSRAAARARANDVLRDVGFNAEVSRIFRAYPHELSGGEQQRIVLAQALACRPSLIIADEPTASLDPDTRAGILALLRGLNYRYGIACLVISHSAEVLAALTTRVLRMEQGTVAPAGASRPPMTRPTPFVRVGAPSAPLQPLIEARGVSRTYRQQRSWRTASEVSAVRDVTLSIEPGTTLGLVGASGSGKSTLARCLAAMEPIDAGEIRMDGRDVSLLRGRALLPYRNRVQLIFQDSASSLSPRLTAAEIIAEPLLIQRVGSPRQRHETALDLMERVGLPHRRAQSRALEFSGGERQRLALARALALQPALIILDESLSGIDPAQRARILDLLEQLQQEHRLAYLFISHDRGLLAEVAGKVLLMDRGRIVGGGVTGSMAAAV